jgi:hypothetical protein
MAPQRRPPIRVHVAPRRLRIGSFAPWRSPLGADPTPPPPRCAPRVRDESIPRPGRPAPIRSARLPCPLACQPSAPHADVARRQSARRRRAVGKARERPLDRGYVAAEAAHPRSRRRPAGDEDDALDLMRFSCVERSLYVNSESWSDVAGRSHGQGRFCGAFRRFYPISQPRGRQGGGAGQAPPSRFRAGGNSSVSLADPASESDSPGSLGAGGPKVPGRRP